jgi:hypothetical protein
MYSKVRLSPKGKHDAFDNVVLVYNTKSCYEEHSINTIKKREEVVNMFQADIRTQFE